MPWGLQRRGRSLLDNKKSRCSVIRSLLCCRDKLQKVISGNNSHSGQGPSCKLFKGEVNFSCEQARS